MSPDPVLDPPIARAALVALTALLAALGAGLLPFVLGQGDRARLLGGMTGLAAGVLLASALLVALPEGFAIAAATTGPAGMGAAVLAGFLGMLVLEAIGLGHDVHEQHHDHALAHGHEHVHHPGRALMIVVGLTLHALTDGLALGAALASQSPVLALSLLLGVAVHKMPAAMSLAVFALHERNDRRRAFVDLLLFSVATPLAVMCGVFFFEGVGPGVVGLAVLVAAGTFLYVATVDVLPEVHARHTGGRALVQVLGGATLLTLVLAAARASGLLDAGH